jgi:hypothetical protein
MLGADPGRLDNAAGGDEHDETAAWDGDTMAEFWGWCSSCARWFYASSAAGGCQPSNLACPVCLAPPLRVEVREYGRTASV